MSDIGFLFAGYGFIWLVLGVYLFTLHRRQGSLAREVGRLEREIDTE